MNIKFVKVQVSVEGISKEIKDFPLYYDEMPEKEILMVRARQAECIEEAMRWIGFDMTYWVCQNSYDLRIDKDSGGILKTLHSKIREGSKISGIAMGSEVSVDYKVVV